jgi:hypothetical protein
MRYWTSYSSQLRDGETTSGGTASSGELAGCRIVVQSDGGRFRLGAGQAESINFASDGAPWIWDRIDGILAITKIPSRVMIQEVLDYCHAIR